MEPRYVIEISRDGMSWMAANEMFTWIPTHFGNDRNKAQEALNFAKGKTFILANGTLQSRIRDSAQGEKTEVPIPEKKPRKRRKKKIEEVSY